MTFSRNLLSLIYVKNCSTANHCNQLTCLWLQHPTSILCSLLFRETCLTVNLTHTCNDMGSRVMSQESLTDSPSASSISLICPPYSFKKSPNFFSWSSPTISIKGIFNNHIRHHYNNISVSFLVYNRNSLMNCPSVILDEWFILNFVIVHGDHMYM